MLLAVTPNPTIDRTLRVPVLTVGAVQRATAVRLGAGGKGLNVARVAGILGSRVLATGPLAGKAGQTVADLAAVEGLAADWFWLSQGETRTCLLINHDAGDATVINEPGPNVSPKDWAGFGRHAQRLAQQAQAVAFSGSIPLGVDPESPGELARAMAAGGQPVYVDTSGPALQSILGQPQGLCIKINQMELAAGLNLAAERPPTEWLIGAGQTLLGRGAALVVVTRGGQGALAIAPEGIWQAASPAIELVSTVGSGDSFLAGLAVARLRGQPIQQALALGVACGSANALGDMPARFERSQVDGLLPQVTIEKLK